jgi:tartrate dehydratase beta subunit/fumarate hydratase class I family protein
MAVGGAAYLVARAIKGSKVVGFEDLGMEAIYEFDVSDMPVTVAVDSSGENVHHRAAGVEEEDCGGRVVGAARDCQPSGCGGKRSATGVALD